MNYPDDVNPYSKTVPWNVPDAVYCEHCEEQQVTWDQGVPERLCPDCEAAEE